MLNPKFEEEYPISDRKPGYYTHPNWGKFLLEVVPYNDQWMIWKYEDFWFADEKDWEVLEFVGPFREKQNG